MPKFIYKIDEVEKQKKHELSGVSVRTTKQECQNTFFNYFQHLNLSVKLKLDLKQDPQNEDSPEKECT